jgi:hypothetical protein
MAFEPTSIAASAGIVKVISGRNCPRREKSLRMVEQYRKMEELIQREVIRTRLEPFTFGAPSEVPYPLSIIDSLIYPPI